MINPDEETKVLNETWRLTARMLATVAQLEKFTDELNEELIRVDLEQQEQEGGSSS